MEVCATLRYLRMSPRKVRQAADLIRAMEVRRAEEQLALFGKRASAPLLKLLRSALASARQHPDLSQQTALYIKRITVGQGPTLKRRRARAFGRAAAIRKRTSHISLVLDTKESKNEK